MMYNINTALHHIITQVQHIDVTELEAQQSLFIRHIENTANTLHNQLNNLPNTQLAHINILPPMSQHLIQSIVAVYGYAKLLLDSPESFKGATISAHQRTYLEEIYTTGRELHHYLDPLEQQAFNYRQEARMQHLQAINLEQLIETHIDIYSFWMRQSNVTVSTFFENDSVMIQAKPYHLSELVQHVLVTIGREIFTDSGQIELYIKSTIQQVQLWIDCKELVLNDSDLQTLFQKDGRHIYLKQLSDMKGTVHIHPQSRSTIILVFPRYAL